MTTIIGRRPAGGTGGTGAEMANQRIRVEGRDARLVGAIAVVSALVFALHGPSPTGTRSVDVVVLFVAGAFVVWTAASAPWWTGVVAAAVAAAFASTLPWAVVAAVPMVAALWVGSRRQSLPWSRAAIAAVVLQVAAHLSDRWFFGFSSLLGVGSLALLSLLGVRRRPRVERRRLWLGLAITAGAGVLATAAVAVAGWSTRQELQDGSNTARTALSYLANGDFLEASQAFGEAAEQFRSASDSLSRPWVYPARLVPVVGQHTAAAQRLSRSAADASEVIAQQLAFIDYDALRVVNGRIDVGAVEILQTPAATLRTTLDRLIADLDDTRNPWLVEPLERRLDDLLADLVDRQDEVDTAADAVTVAPAMLGADEPRVYFIAFTTPAEARGAGGFMGNWAEATVDEGRISITDFGRTADLRSATAEKTLTSPDRAFREFYGNGLWTNISQGTTKPSVWSNITITPHFPTVGAMVAELYPQSGGQELDGVFMMDVYAVAQLMRITGEVSLPDGTVLNADNAASYLLRDQYFEEDTSVRVDALETVARESINRLLGSTLPSPPQLGDLFGQVAREGRLAGWMVRPEEQELLRQVRMTAALPERDGGDMFSLAFNNGSANKIESFLEGEATYDVKVNRVRGRVEATGTIVLRNTAPSTGWPEYVIGNQVGLPPGTSRLQLVVHTALPVLGLTVDGEPAGFRSGTEQGYDATSFFVDLPPGSTAEVAISVGGPIADDAAYRVETRMPPTVNPFPLVVTVSADDSPAPPVD